jgi:hypothetical protein
MTGKSSLDLETEGVEAALKRAAFRARVVAFETRTPLVLFEKGRIVFRPVTRRPRAAPPPKKPE